jgi:hypothetical protein
MGIQDNKSAITCKNHSIEIASVNSPSEILGLIDVVFGGKTDPRDPDDIVFVDEKRQATRQKVLLPASLYSDSVGPYRCVIRDLSATGARLAISRNAKLVPEMRLKITGMRSRLVRCVWRKAEAVGIEFR